MSKGIHPVEPEELMAYLDGELSADRASATLAHLDQCVECQKLAADLRRVSQDLQAWEVGPSGTRIIEGVTVAIREGVPPQQNARLIARATWRDFLRSRRSPWIWGLAGAGLALLLVLAAGQMTFDKKVSRQTVATLVAPESSGRAGDKMELYIRNGLPPAGPQNKQFDRLEQFAKLQNPPKVTGQAGKNLSASDGPMIVRTAALTLTTREFDKTRASLEEVLRRHGGYVGNMNIASPAGMGRTINSTLLAPADQLDATMVELKRLGRVEAESQGGREVTAAYVDLQARLLNARNTERRLTDLLLHHAGQLSEVLAVEVELGRVRGQIEQMEAERKQLAKQVEFATLNATVSEDYQAQLQVVPPSTSTRFRNAAVDGYKTMSESVVEVVEFLISYGPSVLLWVALLFFPARGVWKKLRRRSIQ